MIKHPPYKSRSHDYLLRRLREAANTLQMRDWQLTLEVGDNVPERFRDDDNGRSVCRCWYYQPCLMAEIWISPERCKKEKTDPLFNLYHEIAHIWHETHDEEVRCNVMAGLLLK